MKKSKYIILPLLTSVLLTSCSTNEAQNETTTAPPTEGETVVLSIIEEKQDLFPEEAAKTTTEALESEEKAETTTVASESEEKTLAITEAPRSEERAETVISKSTAAANTTAAPESEEKTTDKINPSVAPPIPTTSSTNDEAVAETETVKTTDNATMKTEHGEQTELPVIIIEETTTATETKPQSSDINPFPPVTTTTTQAISTATTTQPDDKPIELPFVPAL